jgi:hypothetical protein
VTGVAAVLLAWLTAAPLANDFDGLAPQNMPYVPDAWRPAYDWVYTNLGEPLGLAVYYFWGKFAFLCYVAGLFVCAALPRGVSRRSRVGLWLVRATFAVGLVSDAVAYWGGWGAGELTMVTGYAFVFEFPALLLMLVAIGVLGFGYNADRVRPRWVPWFLVFSAVMTLPFGYVFLGYAPHGVLVPVLTSLTVVAVVASSPGQE